MSNFAKNKIRLVPLAAGVLIFLVLLFSLGPMAVFTTIARAKPGYLFLTTGFFILPNLLRIYKWRIMQNRIGSSAGFSLITSIYFSSKFWGMVSPMRSGEVVPALLGSKGNSMRGKLLSIILFDRVIETAQSLMVFFMFFLLFYKVFFNASAGTALAGITVILLVFSFLLFSKASGEKILGITGSVLSNLGENRLTALLKGKLGKLKELLDEFYAATGSYFRLGFTLYVLVLTFVCWGFDMLFWLMLFKAFAVDISLWFVLASVTVYSVMAALAPIPGGLGAAELPFVLILKKMGYIGEAGGIILAARVLSTGYLALAYALSNRLRQPSEASID